MFFDSFTQRIAECKPRFALQNVNIFVGAALAALFAAKAAPTITPFCSGYYVTLP